MGSRFECIWINLHAIYQLQEWNRGRTYLIFSNVTHVGPLAHSVAEVDPVAWCLIALYIIQIFEVDDLYKDTIEDDGDLQVCHA